MEERTGRWLDKIESKLDAVNDMTIARLTEMSTKLDIFLPNQTAHEHRIHDLEKDIAEMKRDNVNRSKNHNIWLGVGTIVGTVSAVTIGVLLDRFFFKGSG